MTTKRTPSVKSDYLNKHYAPVKAEKPRGPKSRTWRGWGVVGKDVFRSYWYRRDAEWFAKRHEGVEVVRVVATLTPVAKKGAKRA